MWKRSYWVLLTYVKRPLAWLLAAGVLFSWLVLYFMIMVDKGYQTASEEVATKDAIRSFEQLDRVLADGSNSAIELDYWVLRSEATDKVFPQPRAEILHIDQEKQAKIHAALASVEGLENVIAMRAGHAIDQATIDRIAKFKTLKRLSLFADLGYETLDLSPLRNLPELEELRIGHISDVESLAPLADLPKLRKLEIGSAQLLHEHGFEIIAMLEHLQILTLPDLQSYSGLLDSLSELSQSSSLVRINYTVSWERRDAIVAAQLRVPDIRIAPTMFRPARHVALVYSLFCGAAIISFIVMHLAGQLSLPAAHLAPNYRFAHYAVAGTLMAMVVVLLSALLVSVGTNVLAAGSLVLVCTAFYFWAGTWIPATRGEGKTARLAGVMIGFTPMVAMALRFYRPMLTESYLMSGLILLPVLFLVIATCVLWRAFRNLEVRLSTSLDRGLPAVLSVRDMQKNNGAWSKSQSGEPPMSRYRQMSMKVPVMAKTTLAVTVLASLAPVLGFDDSGRTAAITCFAGAIVCVYLLGIRWWIEIPYLAAVTTRPPGRMSHVDRLLREVARDFSHLSPLMLASVIAICMIGDFELAGFVQRAIVGVVVVATTVLTVYAALLWILAIRTVIGVAIMAIVAYLLCAAMVMQAALLEHGTPAFWATIAVVSSGCLISAIAIGAVVYVRRYYARIEWARFV